MRKLKFKIEKAKNGQWYFNIVASNGNILATSETYKTRNGLNKAIATIKLKAAGAEVV